MEDEGPPLPGQWVWEASQEVEAETAFTVVGLEGDSFSLGRQAAVGNQAGGVGSKLDKLDPRDLGEGSAQPQALGT